MRQHSTIQDVTAQYLCNAPEKIDEYVYSAFDDYISNGNLSVLLSALHTVNRAKGMEFITENVINREINFDIIPTILQAMGYRVVLQKTESATLTKTS